jgi:hypothetical protein
MFEGAPSLMAPEAAAPGPSEALHGVFRTKTLARWVGLLAHPDRAVCDAERIEQIRLLEELKSAAAAAQAVVTADFVASQRAQQRAAGVPEKDLGKGVAAQVALARRESPHRGSRLVGLAQALVLEMPATMAALRSGEISEWRATLVARETACLTREDRQVADGELAGRLAQMGDGQVEAAAREIAYRLDPHAFMARSAGAARDRRVTLRPAPDTMSRLSGFLPVAQGVAAFAALSRVADGLKATGDERSRGQIMADTMVERLTGQAAADAVPVEVELVMTEGTLLTGADEPAHLVGLGPVPAPLARALARDTDADVWLRRLFTRPEDGALVAMESRRRLFPDALRRFLVLRDQTCRTPWCGAPIRHADHVVPAEVGAETSAANGQGLCEACNHAKQAPGWAARPGHRGAGGTVQITTPTGHTYTSRPPPPPGQHPRAPDAAQRARQLVAAETSDTSPLETRLRRLLDVA